MKDYWTCSKFADWLRGTTKLKCGTAEQWHEWEARAQQNYPVRWWLAEEGLDYLQKFVYWIPDRLHSVKYYINNRWITRTHALTANPRDIQPGQWRDVGDRFLPCLFNELQDYVEVELAWHHLAWADAEQRAKYNAPWWRFGWWNVRLWRSAEAGLDNLRWQMNLVAKEDYGLEPGDTGYGKPTAQARNAKEIYELYMWWTTVYRQRPDPYDASGWTQICEDIRNINGSGGLSMLKDVKDKKLKRAQNQSIRRLHKIEEQYRAEDTAMLIRLIKVRESLWT